VKGHGIASIVPLALLMAGMPMSAAEHQHEHGSSVASGTDTREVIPFQASTIRRQFRMREPGISRRLPRLTRSAGSS
jgi:hypothetical protein